MNIEAGKVYWLPDGGEFQAPYNVDEMVMAGLQHIPLSTHEGRSGIHVARTGITITPEGRIFHTIWDFETKHNESLPCGMYTVEDLVEIEDEPHMMLSPDPGADGEDMPF